MADTPVIPCQAQLPLAKIPVFIPAYSLYLKICFRNEKQRDSNSDDEADAICETDPSDVCNERLGALDRDEERAKQDQEESEEVPDSNDWILPEISDESKEECFYNSVATQLLTAVRLAQLVEYRSIVWEVCGSSPGRTITQGLEIIEEKVLPL